MTSMDVDSPTTPSMAITPVMPADNDEMPISVEQPNKRRRKKSIVWEHFTIETVGAGCMRACCKQCKKSFAYITGSKLAGTSHLKRHIALGICPVSRQKNEASQFTSGAKSDPPKRRYRASPGLGSIPFDQDRCNQDVAKMIIQHEYPLHIVEHPAFVDFVRTLQPQYNMVSFDSIQGECVALYLREKQGLLDLISGIPGRVNLTLDLRTSNYNVGYAFITGHFIDGEWNLHRRILNVVMLPFPDSDYAFNQAVVSCISDWHLEGRLLTLTLDQSFSNDNIIGNLRGVLSVKNLHMFHGQLVKGNCYARVLSRLAQDALGPTSEVVKRVRESVKYVKTSETHDEKFAELRQRLQVPSTRDLIIDDQTKWDTTYHMLVAACELKEVFACLDTTDPVYKINPSMEDWKQVEILCTYLKLLYDAASILTGPMYPPANAFYHEVSKIQLELTHAAMSQDPFVSNLARPLKEKFDQYWRDSFLVLAIAIVMDPRFKMKLVEFSFSRIFGEDAGMWIKIVDDGIHELFLDYLAPSLSVSTSFMGAGNASIPQSDVFQAAPSQEVASQEASFQDFQVLHPADVASQEVISQAATFQELQPEEITPEVQQKEPVQDASSPVINHQEVTQQEMHTQDAPMQVMQTQELPLQAMDSQEELEQEMSTPKEVAQKMISEDVPMQEINTTEAPAQEMHTQQGSVETDNKETSPQEMQVEESVPTEGMKAEGLSQVVHDQEQPTQEMHSQEQLTQGSLAQEQPIQGMDAQGQLTQGMDLQEQQPQQMERTQGMEAQEQRTEEMDAQGQQTQEIDAREKPTQELHPQEKPNEEVDAQEKPTQEMHAQEKPNEEVDTQGKSTQEMDVPEKQTEEMHASERPTQEMDAVEKPTEEMKAVEKPTEKVQGVEKPTEEMHYAEVQGQEVHPQEVQGQERSPQEVQTQEMHPEHLQTQEVHVQTQELHPEEVQTQETHPEHLQTQEVHVQTQEVHAEEVQTQETHPEHLQTQEVHPDHLQIQEVHVHTQEMQPEEDQTQEVHPEEVQTQEMCPEEVQTQEMHVQTQEMHVQTQEMHPQEVLTLEMHPQEVLTQEMHPQEVHTQEMHPQQVQTQEMHVQAQEVHNQEMHLQEVRTQEMHLQEVQTQETRLQEVQAQEMHPQEVLGQEMDVSEGQAQEMHPPGGETHGMHSQEAQTHMMNSQEASTQDMQTQELQPQDMHFQEVQYHVTHHHEVPSQEMVSQGMQAQEMDYQSLSHELQSHDMHTQDLPLLSIGDGLQDFEVYISEIANSQHLKSELDQYLEESLLPRVQEFDVLGWWKLNKLKYPTLAKMAADILSIPVSTVAPESVFDTRSKKIDSYRSSLRPVTLEALVCAKDWLQYGSSSSSLDISNALLKMEY